MSQGDLGALRSYTRTKRTIQSIGVASKNNMMTDQHWDFMPNCSLKRKKHKKMKEKNNKALFGFCQDVKHPNFFSIDNFDSLSFLPCYFLSSQLLYNYMCCLVIKKCLDCIHQMFLHSVMVGIVYFQFALDKTDKTNL